MSGFIKMSKNKILLLFIILLLIFYSLPLLFVNNVLPSHDERFIIDVSLSLPMNSFIMPVNYYGTLHSYYLLFFYSFLLLPGYFLYGNGIEFIKNIYVNNPQLILLISKLSSYILFVFSIVIWCFISKKRKWDFKTNIFILFTLFLTPRLYSFATIVKVEMLSITIISILILIFLKYNDDDSSKNLLLLSIISGLLFSTKYNLIILIVIPLTSFFINFCNSKDYKLLLKNILVFIFVMFITIIITKPVLIISPEIFINDFKYIFSVVDIGHIGWEFEETFIGNLLAMINIFYLNLPLVYFILFPVAFIYYLKKRKYIPLLLGIFVFLIFLFIWKFKLPHYILPILPLIVFISADLFNNIKVFKCRIIFIILIILSIGNIDDSFSYLKSYLKKDSRIIAKEYIEKNIPLGSKILLEDLYNYSPYILPIKQPTEYDAPPFEHRKELKRKYFQILTNYGNEPKYKLSFLNIPLEGKRLFSFKFPDKEYIINNFDYVVINTSISSRLRNVTPSNHSDFIKKAYQFYYEILPEFESKIINNIILYKIVSDK